jgi:hypothetical protein
MSASSDDPDPAETERFREAYPLDAPQPDYKSPQIEMFDLEEPPDSDPVIKPPHYTKWKIEPINFIMRNDMPFWMGNVVKYCMRAEDKNGVEDLRKAIRYIEFRIRQLEGEVEITR